MSLLMLILAVFEPVFIILAIKNLGDDDKWIPYATCAAISSGTLFYFRGGIL